MDITRATELTPEVSVEIDQMFEYQPWNAQQSAAGKEIRLALAEAVKAIIANVPVCPDRTVAIRKVREARMDANSGITSGGKW